MIEFLIIIALIGIIAAIFQDFRFREVANWLNFTLIASFLAFRSFYSALSQDYMFLVFGLVGLSISFVLGHILYYGRLFAGGDAKLFIALGLAIPLADNFRDNNLIILVFLISLLFGGAIYSLIYSIFISYKNRNAFSKEFYKLCRINKNLLYIVLAISSAFVIYVFISNDLIFLLAPGFFIGLFFLYLYAKSVEQSCMLKEISPNKVRVGDWLQKTIDVNGKKIDPHWEGLSKEEVDLIKDNYKDKIIVKDGIPFTPAFLIAFSVILYIQFYLKGNWGLWGIF